MSKQSRWQSPKRSQNSNLNPSSPQRKSSFVSDLNYSDIKMDKVNESTIKELMRVNWGAKDSNNTKGSNNNSKGSNSSVYNNRNNGNSNKFDPTEIGTIILKVRQASLSPLPWLHRHHSHLRRFAPRLTLHARFACDPPKAVPSLHFQPFPSPQGLFDHPPHPRKATRDRSPNTICGLHRLSPLRHAYETAQKGGR